LLGLSVCIIILGLVLFIVSWFSFLKKLGSYLLNLGSGPNSPNSGSSNHQFPQGSPNNGGSGGNGNSAHTYQDNKRKTYYRENREQILE